MVYKVSPERRSYFNVLFLLFFFVWLRKMLNVPSFRSCCRAFCLTCLPAVRAGDVRVEFPETQALVKSIHRSLTRLNCQIHVHRLLLSSDNGEIQMGEQCHRLVLVLTAAVEPCNVLTLTHLQQGSAVSLSFERHAYGHGQKWYWMAYLLGPRCQQPIH